MYIISTATLITVIALASSLAVVVQAAAMPKDHTKVPNCIMPLIASTTTCDLWSVMFVVSEEDVAKIVNLYNKDVNPECTDLVKGDTVRVFLL